MLLLATPDVHGHGHMTWPPSRHGGSLEQGGHCESRACMWFTQPTTILGEPTLNTTEMRTVNLGVDGGPGDWTRKSPWRAPGTAPVLGSGCGVSAGNPLPIPNGGAAWPDMLPQGADGLLLPRREPTVWHRGAIEEVAFALSANHGGGYSWRLCRIDGNATVDEACFQRTVLRFAGKKQWLQYDNQTYQYDDVVKLPRFELPLRTVDEGTFPVGSQWARNPIPACDLCDPHEYCGPAVPLNLSEAFQPGYWMGNATMYGGQAWFDDERCHQHCIGHNMTACPPGMTQFPEPLPGVSGYSGAYANRQGLPFSIVDEVQVPAELEAGDYLLSWRWDCEQTQQIWQNCADVRIVVGGKV